MKYLIIFSFPLLLLSSCKQEEDCCTEPVDLTGCRLVSATGKYTGDSEYEATYDFLYNSPGQLTSVEISTPAGKETKTISYSNGNVAALITKPAQGPEYHQYFEYLDDLVVEKTYSIAGTDTMATSEYEYFMPDIDEDGLYFSPGEAREVYEVANGNVVKTGTYTRENEEKVPQFIEEYFYDDLPNIFQGQFYVAGIFQAGFVPQRTVSVNNMVMGRYIGGGWTRSYSFQFDAGGIPIKLVDMNSGHIIDLVYECN